MLSFCAPKRNNHFDHEKITFTTIVANWLRQEILPEGLASMGEFGYFDTT